MIRYSVVRIKEHRVAAVLVEKRELAEPLASHLIQHIEKLLTFPVMLVAHDDASWPGARVRADFEAEPYLYELLGERDIEWTELDAPMYQKYIG